MPAQQTSIDGSPPVVVLSPEGDEEQVRKLAVEQTERKRRFYTRTLGATALVVVLVIIWAMAEYHNAHGWPTNGFSQSSASTTRGIAGSSIRRSAYKPNILGSEQPAGQDHPIGVRET